MILSRLIYWIVLRVGRPFTRLLFYPICLILLVPRTHRSSRDYHRCDLMRAPRFSDTLKHFHTFSATILDRAYQLTNRRDILAITIHDL